MYNKHTINVLFIFISFHFLSTRPKILVKIKDKCRILRKFISSLLTKIKKLKYYISVFFVIEIVCLKMP